jgi:hypothetical protein
MAIAKEKYPFIFKMLETKTLYETGIEFGFDKHYKDSRAVNNAVYKIYQKVLVDPQKYAVLPETVEKVKAVVSSRAIASVRPETTLREKIDLSKNVDFKELVLSGRKKAFELLNMKMDRIATSKKGLDEVSITALAQTFGILFDKSQIISGEATENIAVLAKIDKDMNSQDALAAILKMREVNNVEKDRTNKKK